MLKIKPAAASYLRGWNPVRAPLLFHRHFYILKFQISPLSCRLTFPMWICGSCIIFLLLVRLGMIILPLFWLPSWNSSVYEAGCLSVLRLLLRDTVAQPSFEALQHWFLYHIRGSGQHQQGKLPRCLEGRLSQQEENDHPPPTFLFIWVVLGRRHPIFGVGLPTSVKETKTITQLQSVARWQLNKLSMDLVHSPGPSPGVRIYSAQYIYTCIYN